MIEILRDPLWQFIGVVIALIPIFALLNKKTKSISYEVITDTDLLVKEEKLSGKIKLVYFRRHKIIRSSYLKFG